jgi:hypothetical protein
MQTIFWVSVAFLQMQTEKANILGICVVCSLSGSNEGDFWLEEIKLT